MTNLARKIIHAVGISAVIVTNSKLNAQVNISIDTTKSKTDWTLVKIHNDNRINVTTDGLSIISTGKANPPFATVERWALAAGKTTMVKITSLYSTRTANGRGTTINDKFYLYDINGNGRQFAFKFDSMKGDPVISIKAIGYDPSTIPAATKGESEDDGVTEASVDKGTIAITVKQASYPSGKSKS